MIVAAALAGVVGCKKGEEAGTAAATSGGSEAPPAGGDPNAAAAGAVPTSFPDMVPQGGTRKLLQSFTVKQAPDPNSPTLTRLGAGTLVDLKGSKGNWMLIMWPSGVGQLSPGWIELQFGDTTKTSIVTRPVVDAGAPPPVVDAGPPPADAGPRRPAIRIPLPKKN